MKSEDTSAYTAQSARCQKAKFETDRSAADLDKKERQILGDVHSGRAIIKSVFLIQPDTPGTVRGGINLFGGLGRTDRPAESRNVRPKKGHRVGKKKTVEGLWEKGKIGGGDGGRIITQLEIARWSGKPRTNLQPGFFPAQDATANQSASMQEDPKPSSGDYAGEDRPKQNKRNLSGPTSGGRT